MGLFQDLAFKAKEPYFVRIMFQDSKYDVNTAFLTTSARQALDLFPLQCVRTIEDDLVEHDRCI